MGLCGQVLVAGRTAGCLLWEAARSFPHVQQGQSQLGLRWTHCRPRQSPPVTVKAVVRQAVHLKPMKVHLEPWRIPMLEQVDAQNKLWSGGKAMLEQDPCKTCGHTKQGVHAEAGCWQDLWAHWAAGAVCSWRTEPYGRGPCLSSSWRNWGLWEGLTLETFLANWFPWEGSRSGWEQCEEPSPRGGRTNRHKMW